jgi:exopolyphosphatase/guanosine-5'-triphosphate,3'-diphosphate pyrophosphatase
VSRFAAIDIGTNAMRCFVAEAGARGEVRVLENLREPVRLGTQVFLMGRIGEAAAGRTISALRQFLRAIERHGAEHVRAIATSAFREASDSAEVVERIRAETGLTITVIDGAEEAHLVRRAVGSRLDLSKGRSAAVDIGGGSVEVLVIDHGDVVRAESYPFGAVRLLEALPVPGRGKGNDFLSLLDHYVDAIRARIRTALGREPVDFVAATGGSAESLAEIAGQDLKGPPALDGGCRAVSVGALRDLVLRLASSTFRQRVTEFNLREDRADVILPAAVVCTKIADVFKVDRILVPGVGLKDGILLDLVEELERKGALESRRREIRAAALGLGRRYALDEPHALKVTELALSLFDQLADLHELPSEARSLLEASSILHDVGLYVSADSHHKHSHYLISQSDIVGLDRRQRQLAANVARYHRRRHPTRQHDHFDALTVKDRETVRKLAAILRTADLLDRDHAQRVRSVHAERNGDKLRLRVRADGDLALSKWAAREKTGLFAEVFGLEVRIEEA